MKQKFPEFRFEEHEIDKELARFVVLDNPKSYPFDQYHSHRYNEIIYFEKGGGIHNINFREFQIEDDSIHILKHGDLHWMERDKNSSGWAIVFKESLLWKMMYLCPELDLTSFYNHSSVINFPKEEADSLQNLLVEIEKNIDAHSAYQLSLISTFLSKVYILRNENNKINCPEQPSPLMYQLLELIEMYFLENWSSIQYADALGLSEHQLAYFIKKSTQEKSLFQLLNERKLAEAKKRLITGTESISEIAYALDFKEPAHFTNWFKKHSGYNPSEFRKGI